MSRKLSSSWSSFSRRAFWRSRSWITVLSNWRDRRWLWRLRLERALDWLSSEETIANASWTWLGASVMGLVALAMPRVRRLVSIAATRLRRQEVSAKAWTKFASVAPLGVYSSVNEFRWSWYAFKSSFGMTTIWPVRPWRRAFREERCLPSEVLGPVECCAFARLISVLFGVDMPCYNGGGSG